MDHYPNDPIFIDDNGCVYVNAPGSDLMGPISSTRSFEGVQMVNLDFDAENNLIGVEIIL